MLLIGAYEGRSALSKMIQAETRSDKSHISVVEISNSAVDPRTHTIYWSQFREELETCPVWEAWGSIRSPRKGSGVFRRTGIHEGHTPGTPITLLIPNVAYNQDRTRDYLENSVGLKYDWMGLVRYLIRVNKDRPSHMFCSELAFRSFAAGGLLMQARVKPAFISPASVYQSPLLSELIRVTTGEAR